MLTVEVLGTVEVVEILEFEEMVKVYSGQVLVFWHTSKNNPKKRKGFVQNLGK